MSTPTAQPARAVPTHTLPTRGARTRQTLTRVLALAVVASLAVVLPAQQTDASTLQRLIVRTTGLPAGTEIGLFRLDRTGTYLGWQESAQTDAAGTVELATIPGQTYTLWAAETTATFPQYLGGSTTLEGATRFTTPDADAAEQQLDVAAAPLVTGTLTWPDKGATSYGEIALHTWDATTKTWALTSYAQVSDLNATGGTFTAKAPAGVPVALSAQVERADGTVVTGWHGSGTTTPPNIGAATVTATAQSPVTGIQIALTEAAPAAPAPTPPPAPSPTAPARSPTTPAPRPDPSPSPTAPRNPAPAVQPAPHPAPRTTPNVAARITGQPKVGARLTATAAPHGWTASYRWKRDGSTIARATARTYKPTPSDAGRRLTVTVTLRKTGHSSAASTSRSVRVAKVTSKVRVSAATRAVRVKVRAVGVAAPTGRVTVTVGTRSRTYALRAGDKGALTMKVPAGRAQVHVAYQGDARVAKSTATRTVRVR